MSKEIRTEIVIKASPETIWKILTDFNMYPKWNSFIRSVNGELKQSEQIVARIHPPGASAMTFKPVLLVVKPNNELRWLGHLLFPGLFDGEHIFELYENTDGSTTFVQREIFRGILVPRFSKMLDTNTLKGFKQMNSDLKAIAEQKNDHTAA